MAVVVPLLVPGQLGEPLESTPVRTSLLEDCLQYRNLESFELALSRIDAAYRDPATRSSLDDELIAVGAKLHRHLLKVLASKDGCELSDLGQDVAGMLLDLTTSSGASQFAKTASPSKSIVHLEVEGTAEARAMLDTARCEQSAATPSVSSTSRGDELQEDAGDLLKLKLDVCLEDGRTLAASKGEKIPMMLWPASLLLAEVVLSNAELFRGQRVLELGAGCHGIVATAASRAGASTVLTTDLSWDAVESMKANLRGFAASLPCCREVQACILDWEHIEDCEHTCNGQQFPVVIGSDIIHTLDAAGLMVRTLKRLLAPGGRAYLVGADSHFRYGVQEFIEMMSSDTELSMEIVPFAAAMAKKLESSSLHSEVMTYSLFAIKRKF